MSNAWVLVGMMGVGKSAVGRALAALSDREFRDTDILLQNLLGKSVAQIFEVYGEAAFRDHEHAALRRLEPGPYVLSTGGGIVMREDNWDEMRRLGTTIYLQAEPETLVRRLSESKKKRPLLLGDEWEQRLMDLLASRQPLYAKADFHISVDGQEIDEVAAAVHRRLESA